MITYVFTKRLFELSKLVSVPAMSDLIIQTKLFSKQLIITAVRYEECSRWSWKLNLKFMQFCLYSHRLLIPRFSSTVSQCVIPLKSSLLSQKFLNKMYYIWYLLISLECSLFLSAVFERYFFPIKKQRLVNKQSSDYFQYNRNRNDKTFWELLFEY